MHYLNENYSYWNPKLTTFPGLFASSAIFHHILTVMDIASDYLSQFRLFNVIYGIILAYILGKFKFYNTNENTLMFQMVTTILPISFFYNFIYYTDTLSSLLVTLYFYMNLANQNSTSKIWLFLVFFILIFI